MSSESLSGSCLHADLPMLRRLLCPCAPPRTSSGLMIEVCCEEPKVGVAVAKDRVLTGCRKLAARSALPASVDRIPHLATARHR